MEAEHHHRAAITANVNMAAGVFRKARIPPSTLVDPCYRGPLIHQMH